MDHEDADNLPPPPVIPRDVVPIKAEHVRPKRVPMPRPVGQAKKGRPIKLLANHFHVDFKDFGGFFFHYNVSLKYEDGTPVDGKGIGRKVIDKLHRTYGSELGNKDFCYDGEKSLFTIGGLPQVNHEFTVVLEDVSSNRSAGNGSHGGNNSPNDGDRKRLRRPYQTKTFTVELAYAAKIPIKSISLALERQESANSQEALRVLDIVLRQNAAKQGCLLVRQSFFHNNPTNFTDIGGGVVGCRGFHSSFRTCQGGLSLNIDVSTTMIVKPGPLVDFLIANQSVRNRRDIDWVKAKRMLKNLRIKATPQNIEYKIVGLSEQICRQQRFLWKKTNNGDGNGDCGTTEITVFEYFVNRKNIPLDYSGDFPCINVGKPKRPTYIPLELCTLVPLQRYTKSLTTNQRASLVEKSRQKPRERMAVLGVALRQNNYEMDPMLRKCDISINNEFTQVDGRVLQAPKLKVGNGEDIMPRNGRWNLNNKRLIRPSKVGKWAVVNFSSRCNLTSLIEDLYRCGHMKGMEISYPLAVIEEAHSMTGAPPTVRVDTMFVQIQKRLSDTPEFLLCVLAERKNSALYGPWKRKCLSVFGIVTQCIAPMMRANDQYLTNVLLKINAKLGGVNSLLHVEHSPAIPLVSRTPTLIIGMDVSHGSPGQTDVPSIAAVVSSLEWPHISKYRASVRTQSSKVEMIDSLFKPTIGKNDDGIIREALLGFYHSSGQRKPEQIIIFRNGVSESQFNQVLNIELDQIIEACKLLDEKWDPKFTFLVAQKNHHTKFFQSGVPDNVPPGTVIDSKVCHPRNFDFYMCAHAGMIGTTRPTHYHTLLDEIGFSPDDLQELVHSLSYVYQRSTTAISVVAPVCYAHLAASQMGQFIKLDDLSDTSSGHGVIIPEMPRLEERVIDSMFFC